MQRKIDPAIESKPAQKELNSPSMMASSAVMFHAKRDSLLFDKIETKAYAKGLLNRIKKVILNKDVQGLELKYEDATTSIKTIFPNKLKLEAILASVDSKDPHHQLKKISQVLAMPTQLFLYQILSKKLELETLPPEMVFFLLNQKNFLSVFNQYSIAILPEIAYLVIELEKMIQQMFSSKHLEQETEITIACKLGNLEAVRYFGCSKINLANSAGLTPLMIAFKNENPELVDLLLRHGADVKQVNKILRSRNAEGKTEFLLACKEGNLQKVRCFISIGANLHEKDLMGNTCLMYAAHGGHTDIVELLLRHGMDPNEKSINNEWNALMCAARVGHTATATLLLDHKADPQIENAARHTALDIAEQHKHKEMITKLSAVTEHGYFRHWFRL
ncbi:MAG: ankyrin repeat domain-containing protein [Gammaproteobacteria bacterium]